MNEGPPLAAALAAFGRRLRAARPLGGGNLHATWAVDCEDGPYVLQRVSPVFAPGIHENIDAVTRRLRARGVPTLELMRTRTGGLTASLAEGDTWRLATRLPGLTHERCPSAEHARSAGALVARFHSALDGLAHRFHPLGIVWHDTAAHRAALDRALETRGDHPRHGDAREIAARIERLAASWAPAEELPTRVVHSDLKFTNLLFDERAEREGAPRATALIDLDTVCRLPLWMELGDAWRSWCNAAGEDAEEAELRLDRLAAAMEGYASGLAAPLPERERASLVDGLERMAVELAVRFATDILEERYFGWDAERFGSRAEHNLVRARGQISLAEQARAARPQIEALVAAA